GQRSTSKWRPYCSTPAARDFRSILRDLEPGLRSGQGGGLMEERRRSPRYAMEAGDQAVLPLTVAVQGLDISVAGVLLQTSRPVKVGSSGCLRLNVGGTPFAADVEVRRALESSDSRHRIGASFVSIRPEHRHVIERFTNQ